LVKKVLRLGAAAKVTTARCDCGPSDHLNAAADAALAVDQLPPVPGPHSRAETDVADSLSSGNLVGVMHRLPRAGKIFRPIKASGEF
jgi:hypothetical protein